MKKLKTAVCAGAAVIALGLSGCSNLTYDVSNELSHISSRSVYVDESVSVDSSIAAPFGLVADVSEDNLIRLTWGCPSVMPDKWYIYLDGKKVDETSILKQIEVSSFETLCHCRVTSDNDTMLLIIAKILLQGYTVCNSIQHVSNKKISVYL